MRFEKHTKTKNQEHLVGCQYATRDVDGCFEGTSKGKEKKKFENSNKRKVVISFLQRIYWKIHCGIQEPPKSHSLKSQSVIKSSKHTTA